MPNNIQGKVLYDAGSVILEDSKDFFSESKSRGASSVSRSVSRMPSVSKSNASSISQMIVEKNLSEESVI